MPTRKNKQPSSVPATQARRAALRVNFEFRYLLSLPAGYAADRSRLWPVLFFFHGRGERGRNLSRVKRHGPPKLIAKGQAFPFIVVSPQCAGDDYWWNYMALDAFVRDITRRFRVDHDRIYLTGLSMGGFATWALAQHAPDRYAAIAPICGGGDSRLAVRLRDVPVWAFHGARDATIPAKRTTEMIKAIRAAGGSPRVTIYPGVGHDSWTKTYENPALYAWAAFASQKSAPQPVNISLAKSMWSFRDATKNSRWHPARVPGCVHLDLQRAGLIPDPSWGRNELDLRWIEERDWEYRCVFHVSRRILGEEIVELVADGLDTVATVSLNSHVIARTANMFTGYRWPVQRQLRAGRNELRVRFTSALEYVRTHRLSHRPRELSDPVGGVTRIRKQQCQFGWDWGPRLVTCGIWRELRLEAWSGNRLTHVHVAQYHRRDGRVKLDFTPELAQRDERVRYDGTVSFGGRVAAEITHLSATVESPSLWWPNGHGAQPLYDVELIARDDSGREVSRWRKRIGLRTVALERKPDRWGESFRFVINGRAIFAKGANWIPAHSFVAGLAPASCARNLRAAATAHMNMLRVWGGGVYESEAFYDHCDELGLLVWQDFMFACTRYPGDAAFLASVRAEAAYQVRRLHHRASLALWCGNNEVAQLNPELRKPGQAQASYKALFHSVLPAVVAKHDGTTAYWPSSPWRGNDDQRPEAGERRGDTHYWDVWHAQRPVKDYERWRFRFASEFGMQSYSSPETNALFCPRGESNVFGPAMENHQKNRAGNQLILDYISRRYRFPKSQDDLTWLSQLNQAHCMQVAVEHWRRHQPRCMGALYWQLNDCWPATSWSSIEFTGRWKALHHVARRFFAPLLVTAQVPGDEMAGLGNYRRSTVRWVHLYTVCEKPEGARGQLRWELRHVDGRVLRRGAKAVVLRYGESRRQVTLDLAGPIARHGREKLFLRIALECRTKVVSEDSVFLTPPRFIALPHPIRTRVAVRQLSATLIRLTFLTAVFQHRFAFELPGIDYTASDNWFDLYPGRPKRVTVEFSTPRSAAAVLRVLRWRSLADTVA